MTTGIGINKLSRVSVFTYSILRKVADFLFPAARLVTISGLTNLALGSTGTDYVTIVF